MIRLHLNKALRSTSPTKRARSPWLALIAASVLLFPAACDRRTPTESGAPPAAVQQTFTLGSNPDQPEARLTLSADRSTMTVADRLTVVLTIEASDTLTTDWMPPSVPEPAASSVPFGDFTLAAVVSRTPPASSGRQMIEHTLVLEPFLDGKKSVPAVAVQLRSAAGSARTITTEPMEITVRPVLPPEEAEKAELAPARDPVPTALRALRGSPFVAAAAASLLAAWLGTFVWARLVAVRRTREIDPICQARQRLTELRGRLARLQSDPFASDAAPPSAIAADLGVTIRDYLERHLRIPALGATAAQLSPRLASSPLPPVTLAKLAETLAALERAAFAPESPRSADLLPHLELAERLVETTVNSARSSAQEAGA